MMRISLGSRQTKTAKLLLCSIKKPNISNPVHCINLRSWHDRKCNLESRQFRCTPRSHLGQIVNLFHKCSETWRSPSSVDLESVKNTPDVGDIGPVTCSTLYKNVQTASGLSSIVLITSSIAPPSSSVTLSISRSLATQTVSWKSNCYVLKLTNTCKLMVATMRILVPQNKRRLRAKELRYVWWPQKKQLLVHWHLYIMLSIGFMKGSRTSDDIQLTHILAESEIIYSHCQSTLTIRISWLRSCDSESNLQVRFLKKRARNQHGF